MYTRQQASVLRQAFWTTFGQYMAPLLSAEGEKINWINYKTGEKQFTFKMVAENNGASIGIEITHADPGMQLLYFEQLRQLKKLLEECLGEAWTWQLHTIDENGKTISRVFKTLEGVSVYKKEDWPALISFFKPRMLALDNFWSSAKYAFEALH